MYDPEKGPRGPGGHPSRAVAVDRRFAECDGVEAVGIEPSPVCAGDAVAKVSGGRNYGGPSLGHIAAWPK